MLSVQYKSINCSCESYRRKIKFIEGQVFIMASHTGLQEINYINCENLSFFVGTAATFCCNFICSWNFFGFAVNASTSKSFIPYSWYHYSSSLNPTKYQRFFKLEDNCHCWQSWQRTKLASKIHLILAKRLRKGITIL